SAVFFFQAEDGIRDLTVTGVQTCALPILVVGEGACDVGARLLAALVEPFELSGHRITVGASIGVATGADAVEDLLRNADVAMYQIGRASCRERVWIEVAVVS